MCKTVAEVLHDRITRANLGLSTMTRPEKHSLTLHGHRTSVSLEAEFWQAFRRLAQENGMTLNELAVQIDDTRGDTGLASAIRVFVLNTLLARF